MNISVNSTNQSVQQTLIVGVPEHLNQFETLSVNGVDIRENIGFLKQNHLIGSSLGKVYQTHFQLQDEHYRLISVGLGNLKQLDYTQLLQVFGKLFQFLKSEHILSASLLFESFISKKVSRKDVAEVLGQQSVRAIYQFDNYKSNKSALYSPTIFVHSDAENIADAITQGKVLGESINTARTYSNMPPNILTPGYYVELIDDHFKDSQVEVDIKDGEQLQDEGFGLIHAVGKGSAHSPRVITITYNGGPQNVAPIALVGKGITYDSGGYSIKPKVGMQTMKFDMCGSANVIGMIEAAARLQLPVNIVGVIAAAENMVNEAAMKPDDIFTALSGESVEVLNTDAEGRLVLGDAVFYANQFQPSVILDFATLTGAAVAALGEDKAAVFKNNTNAPINEILTTARKMDEFVFELPITSTEQQLIRQTDVADLVNHTNGHGKALFAATFISHFACDTPHLHFDIAGPATTTKASYLGPKGPTGYMIPTIVEWLRQQ